MKNFNLIKFVLSLLFLIYFGCQNPPTTDRPGGSLDGETSPMIWSGQYQRIRANEQLDGKNGYRLICRAHDGSNFQDGQTIRFELVESPIGANIGGMFDFTTTTLPNNDPLTQPEVYPGSAVNGLIRPDMTGVYKIRASHVGGNNAARSKLVTLVVIEDEEETSFSQTDWGHETRYGDEIPGDGYDDLYESANDQNIKNLRIELDYVESIENSVDEIIDIAETILNTGGFKADIVKDQKLTVGSNNEQLLSIYQNRKELKGTLRETRQHKEYIHAILATQHSNNALYGYTVQYFGNPPEGEGWTHLDCANGASGESDQNPSYRRQYLDSTGCMIFVTNISNESLPNPTWTHNKAIAWTLAHEIGHAIGINAHNLTGKSIMSNAPFSFQTANYADYDSFGEFELLTNRNDQKYAINLRDILGRDNIDIGW